MSIAKRKRGLSPVIATVLLISIALVLAIIIFIWAKTFVSERVEKFGEPIENSCDKVVFEVEAIEGDGIYILNKGNVALYGIEIRKKRLGSLRVEGVAVPEDLSSIISGSGETVNVPIPEEITSQNELLIVPMILGETNSFKRAYTCDQRYGVETIVQSRTF